MEPKPFQKPYPPLWFGGASEPALRRAVRLGDGFFGAGASPTDKFAEQVQIVRAALAEAGRPAEGFPIAKRVYIAIDEDAERARPDERRPGSDLRDTGCRRSRPPRSRARRPTASAR